jgi:hypothetical protein
VSINKEHQSINQQPLIVHFSFSAIEQMHGQQSDFILVKYFMQLRSAAISAHPVYAAFLHG